MREHRCPVCGRPAVPVFLAACQVCFKPIPRPLATALIRAWKGRVLDPAGYQEVLAAVLLWARDKRSMEED